MQPMYWFRVVLYSGTPETLITFYSGANEAAIVYAGFMLHYQRIMLQYWSGTGWVLVPGYAGPGGMD